MINFVCVFYGDKYKPNYVQNLYNMVKRHLTVDHKFICFTDNTSIHKLVEGDIEFRQFPLFDEQGWWSLISAAAAARCRVTPTRAHANR